MRTEIGCSAQKLNLRLPFSDHFVILYFKVVSRQPSFQDNVFQLRFSNLFPQSKAWLNQHSLDEQKVSSFLTQGDSLNLAPPQVFVATLVLNHQIFHNPICIKSL